MYRKTTIIVLSALIISMFSLNVTAGTKSNKKHIKQQEVKEQKHNTPVECLAKTVYYEARGESEEGKKWVAHSVVNRSKHPKFPKDICSVISERHNGVCQFSWYCKGWKIKYGKSWDDSVRVAKEALTSEPVNSRLNKVLFFHAVSTRPSWGKRYRKIAKIDNHIFYGDS